MTEPAFFSFQVTICSLKGDHCLAVGAKKSSYDL
jgi:hypothetical protein